MRTVSIPLKNRVIKLQNVGLVSECNSNLISLGQLRESETSFHNNSTSMTLIKNRKIIVHVRKNQNLFLLDFVIPGKIIKISHKSPMSRTIVLRRRERSTHLVNKNKKIRIWHRKLSHVNNARVIRALTLVDGIDLF